MLAPMITDAKLNEVVRGFVAKVTALAREAAIATLNAQLAGGEVHRRRTAPISSAKSRGASPARAKGAKRPADEVARLETTLASHIAKNPGHRVEQINKVLGTTTKDVRLPLAKLVSAGRVKTKGNRRATKYFAA